jgi:hypothetical protein
MRIMLPMTALVAALALALSLGKSGSDNAWARWWSSHERGHELEQAREAVGRFQEELRRVKAAVLAGSLALPDAADRVAEAARQDHPTFLTGLAFFHPDLPERERVVHCLLGHFEMEQQLGMLTPEQCEQADRLRAGRGPDLGGVTLPESPPTRTR